MSDSTIEQVRRDAELLYDAQQVEAAINGMAASITEQLQDSNPVLMPVMLGGLYLGGMLLPKLNFALQVDYLHATRYRNELHGHDLEWKVAPDTNLSGRNVLIIDDILDDGVTLSEVVSAVESCGAEEVLTAVLVVKNRERTVDTKIDFSGLTVPDRYVFGCGMDYRGYWRNLPGIYAVAD